MAKAESCAYCGRSGTVTQERGEYVVNGIQLTMVGPDRYACLSRGNLGYCPVRMWDSEESKKESDIKLPGIDVAGDEDQEFRKSDTNIDGVGIYVHPGDRGE